MVWEGESRQKLGEERNHTMLPFTFSSSADYKVTADLAWRGFERDLNLWTSILWLNMLVMNTLSPLGTEMVVKNIFISGSEKNGHQTMVHLFSRQMQNYFGIGRWTSYYYTSAWSMLHTYPVLFRKTIFHHLWIQIFGLSKPRRLLGCDPAITRNYLKKNCNVTRKFYTAL